MAKQTSEKNKSRTPNARPANNENIAVSEWKVPNWWLPFILAITAVVYFKSLNNGFTDMDDDYYIVRNYLLRDFSLKGIALIFTKLYSYNYHPLTTLSNLLEFQLFGLNPLPYHAGNVLLHLLNSLLTYRFVRLLSGKKITAIVVSGLFALHPLHVESVAWVAERKDVLYAAFYLGGLIAYLKYMENGNKPASYALMVLLFLCSLLSKSAAVTFPLILIIIDFYNGRAFTVKTIVEKIPFFVLSVIFGIVNIMAQKTAISNVAGNFGAINRIFLIVSGFDAYILQLFVPNHLTALHYYPAIKNGLIPWLFYCSVPFTILLLWVVFFQKSKIKKEIIFGFLFFSAAVSVMLQLISVGLAYYSERYTYISSIGIFFVVGHWASTLGKPALQRLAIGSFAAILMVFALQTWQQIDVWKSSETLFTDILEKNPDNPNDYTIYWYRGNYRLTTNDGRGALEDFNMAINVNPKYEDAYYNRGRLYEGWGNRTEAIADYNKVIELNPKSADAFNNRGWVKFESGDSAGARQDFIRAVTLNPNYAEAFNNKGWEEFVTGDNKAAMADFDSAIKLQPHFTKPYFNRAVIKANTGDFKGAIVEYNNVIAMFPTDSTAYFNRAIMKLNTNDTLSACADMQKAVQFGNNNGQHFLKDICPPAFSK
jgi:protein O-mannosyl-transferase